MMASDNHLINVDCLGNYQMIHVIDVVGAVGQYMVLILFQVHFHYSVNVINKKKVIYIQFPVL